MAFQTSSITMRGHPDLWICLKTKCHCPTIIVLYYVTHSGPAWIKWQNTVKAEDCFIENKIPLVSTILNGIRRLWIGRVREEHKEVLELHWTSQFLQFPFRNKNLQAINMKTGEPCFGIQLDKNLINVCYFL